MKKNVFIIILFSIFTSAILADDLADILQDLAVQTACLGMYSTAQTGVYVTSRYDDPTDWYNPPLLANRFADMSGNMTRTITFYGVCFDYAQFAWDDINKYKKMYNNKGMKENEWYIAVANKDNPNTIILYDPVSKEKSTITMNGVYLKEKSRHNIYAHDGATGHAWLWVQHNNGTWYWIDPTWTDNTGYPWWGKVENGKEVQYDPNPDYCMAKNYPGAYIANNIPQYQPSYPSQPSYSPPNNTPQYQPPYPSQPNYSPSNNYNKNKYMISMLGYNLVPDMPLGFTIGIFGFYTSFNWSETYYNEKFSYGSPSKNSVFTGDSKEGGLEFTVGYSFYLFNKYLRLPVGIGMRMTDEYYSYEESYSEEKYYSNSNNLENKKLILETGFHLIIFENFYLSGTYRLIGFEKHSFTLGTGIIFCGD